MSVYEIINPSDPITFECDDDDVARVAALVLGRGAYGVQREDGERVLPVLRFGGFDEWYKAFTARVGCTLNGWIRGNRGRMAVALDTTAVCSLSNRKALLAATKGDPEAVARWNEEKRSSMNNICKAARALAKNYREAPDTSFVDEDPAEVKA